MNTSIFVFIVIAILVILIPILLRIFSSFFPRKLQMQNIKLARETLKILRAKSCNMDEKLPLVLGTLRKVDPFVFEELILLCFQERGGRIVRNKRYTGDGGIDGRVFIKGKLFLIQAKRYKQHIAPEHVRDFQRVVAKSKAKGGLFIHTGKTGKLSKELVAGTTISMISGQKLVNLVLNERPDSVNSP